MTKFDQRKQRVENQYNAVRDINLHQTVIPSLNEAEQRYNRREMLKRVQVWRVDPILDRAFHEMDRISVAFHYQLNEEVNPWKSVVQESNKPLLPLPTGLSIAQVYDQSGGQLLILGEPGTGKTILLLELARNLLDKAVQDDSHPIPVILICGRGERSEGLLLNGLLRNSMINIAFKKKWLKFGSGITVWLCCLMALINWLSGSVRSVYRLLMRIYDNKVLYPLSYAVA